MELLNAIIWAVGSVLAFYNGLKDGINVVWLIIACLFVFNTIKQARKYWNIRNPEK